MDNHIATNSRYWIEVKLPFPYTLVRRQYQRSQIESHKSKYPGIKIFLIHFEEPLRNSKPSAEVISDAHLFDFIFTSDRNIVNIVPNAHWAPLAECWTNGSMKCVDQIDRTAEAKEKNLA